MKFLYLTAAVSIFSPSLVKAAELEIYSGEPFAEALHDVVLSGGVPISHKMAKASQMSRTDAFRLKDGRVVVISSVAKKLQEPYSVVEVFVSAQPGDEKKPEPVKRLVISTEPSGEGRKSE